MINLIDVVVAVVLISILAAAIIYIVKAKKNGIKCIGCPAGCSCQSQGSNSSDCGCGCGCNGSNGKKSNCHAE